MTPIRVELRAAERGGIRTEYDAQLWVDGRRVGYVQKEQGSESYRAYSGGLLVARERTLRGLREELAEHFQAEGLPS